MTSLIWQALKYFLKKGFLFVLFTVTFELVFSGYAECSSNNHNPSNSSQYSLFITIPVLLLVGYFVLEVYKGYLLNDPTSPDVMFLLKIITQCIFEGYNLMSNNSTSITLGTEQNVTLEKAQQYLNIIMSVRGELITTSSIRSAFRLAPHEFIELFIAHCSASDVDIDRLKGILRNLNIIND